MKTKKRTKINWDIIPVIEVYKSILNGEIKTFPYRYLNKERSRTILRYVALTKYNMTREQICKDITVKFLRKHFIVSINKIFAGDWHHMIDYCFDEMNIMPWELVRVKDGFWEDVNNRKAFVMWVSQKENVDITKADELRKLTGNVLRSYGGQNAIITSGTLFELINLINPMHYKEWEVCTITLWDDDKRKDAIRWLIEEKLRWDEKTVKEQLSTEHFFQNNLRTLFDYFHHNRNKVLEFAYPGKYSRLKRSPINERYAQNETI
ncbi:MAG: DUF4046 domain-containing protein [Clostridia bacterium]|nr:DUF4046 domain-containing protein [Clostridia bacterium]